MLLKYKIHIECTYNICKPYYIIQKKLKLLFINRIIYIIESFVFASSIIKYQKKKM